jgi:Fe-S-cluster-containing dehydrogenase component
MRYGMVIDLRRCIGCYGCQIACKAENCTPPEVLWSRVLLYEWGNYPLSRRLALPVLCMHCADPPCVKACPNGATAKGPDGIVTVDADKCMGCGSCIIACPYQARTMNRQPMGYFGAQGLTPYEQVGYKKHTAGVVGKCDFCRPRLSRGLEPACVIGCLTKARFFGDLEDPHSQVSQLIQNRRGFQIFPELGTDPSVFYLPP